MEKGRIAYHLLAFLVVALWGITFISTKVLISGGLHPAGIFAIRFTIAYIGIWLLCLVSGDRKRPGAAQDTKLWSGSIRDEIFFVLLGVTGGSMYFLTENTALSCTQACNVSFIVCSAPLLTAMLTLAARRFLHGPLIDGLEDVRIAWPLVVGTILAMGGMAAVLFDGRNTEAALSAAGTGMNMKGGLLAFAAACCWAFYSLLMSQMTERYGALFATRKVFFWGLVTIIPFLPGTCPDISVFLQPRIWGNLLFLSIVASLACFVLWNKVMARVGNVTSTNYVYLNPFFTLVFAVAILGESLTPVSAIGCISIVLGVIIGGLKTSRS